MMHLLLDQGVPRQTADLLRAVGVVVEHVSDLGMAAASDDQILAYAQSISATVITHDSDFHALLALSGQQQPSVIRLRDEKLRHEAIAPLLLSILQRHGAALKAGAAVSVRGRRIRIHKLPITSLGTNR